ncbi:N-acetyltransferase family protein [Candidatus Hodarchaeum mangrovi]
MSFEIIDVNSKNLDKVGLFCKQSQKKEEGYQNKITWIKERFPEGLKYKILKVKEKTKYSFRGFIEYIPSKYNWRGINADYFMVIHCLWIVGQHKGKGYATTMIQLAIDDAVALGMNGVIGMTAEKGGWLPNKRIFEKMGFQHVDQFDENIGLYAKFLNNSAPKPSFYPIYNDYSKKYSKEIFVAYSHQCPYIPALIEDIKEFARNNKVLFQSKLINSASEAQHNAIHPYGTYGILLNGKLISYKPGMRKKTVETLQSMT